MAKEIRDLLVSVMFLCTCFTSSTTALNVTFEKASTFYLPYTYSPTEMYDLGEDAAEQIAYDAPNKLLYSVGNTNIHVIDLSATNYSMNVLYRKSYVNVGITDVEVCGNYVFVAFNNDTDTSQGFVNVYEAYNHQSNTMNMIHSIVVGTGPDMIHPTSDCSKVVVAVEAEPYTDTQGTFVDPPGGVGIIKFNTTPADSYTYNLLGFEAFNSRVSELEQSGVRFVYRGNNNTFSNDVEPEYIAFNHDETKAYVSLQENNAIAVVDIQSDTIEEIYGLGFKNWSLFTLDPSDRDGGINLNAWHIMGMYQPDSMTLWRRNNIDYIMMANEGDGKDYDDFTEEARVKDITLSSMFELNATERARLQEDRNLGRLKITTIDGQSQNSGEYDHLYTYGGRSFSIRRTDTMELVYDSGNDIAYRIATMKPYLFNSNAGRDFNITSSADQRSDDKGAEPEGIITAELGDHTLIMVGNERPGTIAVYSLDNRQPMIFEPKFETLLSDIPEVDETWGKVYDERRLSMLDPEGMIFVSETDSPHGEPLLIVGGSYSGTITVFKVIVHSEESGDPNSTPAVTANIGFLLFTAAVLALKKLV